MTRYVRKAGFVLLLAVIASCGDATGPKSLAAARTLWNAQNLTTYSYFGSQTCFCLSSGSVVVQVTNGKVSAVNNLVSGVPVPTAGWLTIDELFDLAARAQPEVLVFDKSLGFPRRMESCCLADDSGFVYTVSGLSQSASGS